MRALAEAGADALPMPASRAATLQRIGRIVADGDLVVDAGIDRAAAVERLLDVKGIGPWTAQYVAMRGLGDPDVFLDTDLGVRHALAALGLDASSADRWRPWRTYAMHHLWNTL